MTYGDRSNPMLQIEAYDVWPEAVEMTCALQSGYKPPEHSEECFDWAGMCVIESLRPRLDEDLNALELWVTDQNEPFRFFIDNTHEDDPARSALFIVFSEGRAGRIQCVATIRAMPNGDPRPIYARELVLRFESNASNIWSFLRDTRAMLNDGPATVDFEGVW